MIYLLLRWPTFMRVEQVDIFRGIQIRKLYEPEHFPNAAMLPVFDQYFGSPQSRYVCTQTIAKNINVIRLLSWVSSSWWFFKLNLKMFCNHYLPQLATDSGLSGRHSCQVKSDPPSLKIDYLKKRKPAFTRSTLLHKTRKLSHLWVWLEIGMASEAVTLH